MLKKERLDWIGNEQLESCHSSIRWMEIHILLFFLLLQVKLVVRMKDERWYFFSPFFFLCGLIDFPFCPTCL